MATQGTATVDFGAFPGKSDASIAVTGQTGIAANALVEAWIFPSDTADHSAEEHIADPPGPLTVSPAPEKRKSYG